MRGKVKTIQNINNSICNFLNEEEIQKVYDFCIKNGFKPFHEIQKHYNFLKRIDKLTPENGNSNRFIQFTIGRKERIEYLKSINKHPSIIDMTLFNIYISDIEESKISYLLYCKNKTRSFYHEDNDKRSLSYHIKKYGIEEGNRIYDIKKNTIYKESTKRRKEYWLKRGYTEEEAIVKVSEVQRTFTKEKCIEKYGQEEGLRIWQDRQDKWQETMNNKSDEEKARINKLKNVYNKRLSRILNIEIHKANEIISSIDYVVFSKYKSDIYKLSNIVYYDNINLIDPERKRNKKYHLDHKYSILMGYLHNVSVDTMSCIHNLQIITAGANSIKNVGCSITLDLLNTLYDKDKCQKKSA